MHKVSCKKSLNVSIYSNCNFAGKIKFCWPIDLFLGHVSTSVFGDKIVDKWLYQI